MNSPILSLAPVLDTVAAEPLRAALLEACDAPLALDGSQVDRLGGLCLQVLLAAQARWAAQGQDLSIVDPSAAFVEALGLAGCTTLLSDNGLQ